MLENLGTYYKIVLSGRFSKLLSLEFFLSVAVSIAVVFVRYNPSTQAEIIQIQIADLARALGTYGALGMGTCLTTLALAARWTSGDFNDFYRSTGKGDNQLASYSTLLFKLSWTAISHWFALLLGLTASLVVPKDWELVSGGIQNAYSSGVGAAIIFSFVYCISSFFSVLLQVSVLCMIRKEFMDQSTRQE
jgi:ABC-type Mn2+/Zn2+ transport system permease subunit